MTPEPSIPTRIVEPETVHVHEPITRIDGSPAFASPAVTAEPVVAECDDCTVASDEALVKSTRRNRN
jgi:hypothetical protein